MDSSVIVESLEGTLSPSQDVRKQSELKLAIFENEPNFLNLLLGLSIDVQSSKQTRASSSIYFKNKVIQNWMHLDTSKNRNNKILVISPDEKKSIRENLVNSILISCNDQQIRQQLTTALYHILVIEEWPELCDLALSLVREQKQQDHVYTGLLLIYEITKSKRWSLNEDRKLLNEVVEKSFPVLTAIAEPLISSFTGNNGEINSNNNNTNSNIYSEMLYLLLKIFKYSTFLELSPYFINNLNNLSKWVQFHLAIIDSNNLQELNSLDEIERNNNKKAKCLKWSFANLHRLQAKFGGGMSTTIKDSEFTKIFSSHFVPEILNIYWQAIAEWSQGKRLYTESCLYHLISFIDQCCGIDESWQLIQPKFDGILEHVLFKSLCATNETIELFEDDPEEYFRRFFDMNKDFKTSDVASINLLFSLCFKRFPVIINSVLNLLNNVFTKRSASMDDVEIAKEVEGALRILSTISFKIDKKSSPVSNQVDQLINSFIVPELSPQNRFKFLSTRACDTIARFTYQYKDMNVLLSVYQGCLTCFQNQDCMPLQVCAVDALSNLITEPNVKEAISEHITSIMEKLLYLSDNHEFDIINDIMDEFVDQFALQLEPFAVQIASNLNAQFIKIATELLENHNLTDDINKEYQAIGLLSTMTTMILSMTSSKDITSKLLQQFAPSIEIVIV
ncbi:hypothetical protein PACTADRAFT_2083 [Pachysolen tannophilus NRRL Y-2460]|uniref:Importin N-terminal domain-containing protein n=1 Tax=Pachysolen tannophilus NRRL Y-2460 TaxID=669874 RepID=A0A1E4TVI1_PACTA|nr:hypothetical protein PACTADRAFT_2083 [Pachysolen tannophilus NRRL Y-2460]